MNLRIILYAFIFKIVFEIAYVYFASPIFSYMGIIYIPNISKFFISNIIFFILILMLPVKKDRPSSQLLFLLFLNSLIPFLSVYWLANKSTEFMLIISLVYAFMFLFAHFVKPFNIPLLKKETNIIPKIAIIIFLLSIILLIMRTIQFGGIDTRAFNFSSVYDLREDIQYQGMWAYLNNWLGRLFLPLCIIIFYIKKNRIMFIFAIFMQLFLYLSSGSKSTLFAIVLIIMALFFLKRGNWETGFAKLYIILIGLSIIVMHFYNNIWLIALIVIRQFALPPVISNKYFDFFSENEKLMFSEGIIGKTLGISSPYDIKAAYIISGSIGNHENTGFLSDAYSNGGILAMFIIAFIFMIILLFIDSISRYSKNRILYTAMLVYPIIILNDGSLLTLLLTSGLIILLFIMYLLASEEYNATQNDKKTKYSED